MNDLPFDARPHRPLPPRRRIGELVGPRSADVVGRTVRRYRPDGSYDFFTTHLTRWGARRAARLYERTGQIRGWLP